MEKGTGANLRVSRSQRIGRWLQFLSALAIVAVVAVLGAHQIAAKVAAVKPVQFIGHSDDAAYALMGQSLAEGRGIHVPYISTFFIPYPHTIYHREDHWPPFMGFSIAPLFYFFGKQAWIARLPAIFYGSIGLPLVTALLTYALSRRGYAALLAALLIMSSGQLYEQSERTLSDISTAMLVAGFLGSLILARRHPWMHLLAGAFAAGAYFAKGSELYLIALYPLLAALCNGLSIFRRRWVYIGLATALFLVAPFLYANWRDYGNPIHSTQNYVSGFFGFEDWDSRMYFPYWGHNLPQPSDRWRKHPREYPETVHSQIAETLEYAFSGCQGRSTIWRDWGTPGLWLHRLILGTPARFWLSSMRTTHAPIKPISQWESPIYELAAVGAFALLFTLLIRGIGTASLALWQRLRFSGPLSSAPAKDPRVRLGPVLAVILVFCTHVAFLAFFWSVEQRFCFPLLPLLLALGCAAATCLIEWPLEFIAWLVRITYDTCRLWRGDIFLPRVRMSFISTTGAAAVTLCIAAVLLGFQNRVYAAQQQFLNVGRDYPFSIDNRFVYEGEWIARNLPHAIVMCRNPWELQFTMGPENKSVGLPNPESSDPQGAEKIFAIARYYGVTHLLVDDIRPALRPYLLQRVPGMKRVPGGPMALFELDWSKLPDVTVERIFRNPAPPQ